MTLRVQYFSRFYADFRMDEQGVIVLADQNGTIMVRHPFDKNMIGRSIAKGDIFSKYLPHASRGVHMVVAITDKVERMYGYERLNRYPLVVLAGKSKRAILASWYEFVWLIDHALSDPSDSSPLCDPYFAPDKDNAESRR